MDTRLLETYERELRHMKEMGAEFAAEYPNVAAGLRLPSLKDPFVERLLEGFAFLSARTQVKLDARHPEFTQHLLEVVYPGFLAPIPSCCIAEFIPNAKAGSLDTGVRIPRGSSLRAPVGIDDRAVCQFRTAHDVMLWPIELREVRYLAGAGSLAALGISGTAGARAAMRLTIVASSGIDAGKLPIDELIFFIVPTADLSARLHEQVLANCAGVAFRRGAESSVFTYASSDCVTAVGLEDTEALLPPVGTGFQGYRLLQEYFAFPERLLFFRVTNLRAAFSAARGQSVELYLLFNSEQQGLENALDSSHIRLNCTPAVNLFPRSADRIQVTARSTEMHMPIDRNRPMDFELHSITAMRGINDAGEVLAEVAPLYNVRHGSGLAGDDLFYTMQRRPRIKSLRQQHAGPRTPYLGSEAYLSVVDRRGRQFSGELRQLEADTLCTNRDLPMLITPRRSSTDFEFDGAAPIGAIRCLVTPTDPRDSPAFGDTAWRLVSHLSLNYLSLTEEDPIAGATLLREMLSLYAKPADGAQKRQIEGIQRVRYEPVVRRIPGTGPIVYGRGIQVTLSLDDGAFAGTGIIALSLVLDRFLARYSSINSFTQLCLESLSRGSIKRWAPRIGRRQLL